MPTFIQNIYRNENGNPKPRGLIQLKLSIQKITSYYCNFFKINRQNININLKYINQMKSKFFYTLSICNLLAFSFYLFSFSSNENAKVVDFQDKIIKVRGVVVVDSLGVERVIIGSHLPEPNLGSYGSRLNSRGKVGVSGVMIYNRFYQFFFIEILWMLCIRVFQISIYCNSNLQRKAHCLFYTGRRERV